MLIIGETWGMRGAMPGKRIKQMACKVLKEKKDEALRILRVAQVWKMKEPMKEELGGENDGMWGFLLEDKRRGI